MGSDFALQGICNRGELARIGLPLPLRRGIDLFANLRPAMCFDALADASSLKREFVAGLDILLWISLDI